MINPSENIAARWTRKLIPDSTFRPASSRFLHSNRIHRIRIIHSAAISLSAMCCSRARKLKDLWGCSTSPVSAASQLLRKAASSSIVAARCVQFGPRKPRLCVGDPYASGVAAVWYLCCSMSGQDDVVLTMSTIPTRIMTPVMSQTTKLYCVPVDDIK
jgi:hypothetical protein